MLFTDVGLPGGMNGRQLAEEARKRRPNLKVLFTTAYARNAIVHDGRLDPGVELLTKPFTQAALGEKLRDIIDARSTPARVLLVEDETLIQMLATEYLEEAGLKVDTAVSAAEALNKLAAHSGRRRCRHRRHGTARPQRRCAGSGNPFHLSARCPSLLRAVRRKDDLRSLFEDMKSIVFVSKPYTADQLCAALRAIGIY